MQSWNEIHKSATAFFKRWRDACDENFQAQSFLKNCATKAIVCIPLPEGGPPIVMVLARGMWRSVPVEYRATINAGRMLVVSPFSQGVVRVSKETAERRNGWILDHCGEAVFASLDPNGSLARLVAPRPNLRRQIL